jgi:hypothetical protein
MASNYVTLVNKLLLRLNEVPLDIGGEGFGGVRGVQALAKDSVNNSIREILQDAQEWPFLKKTVVQTLTAGVREYAYPSDYSSSDIETFYLKKSISLNNEPAHLPVINYEDYIQNFRAADDSGNEGVPRRVFQTYEDKFGVSPTPNGAYEVEYVYWSFPSDLVSFNDICIIPARFDSVIIDGAMMYMMRFRSNDQSALLHQQKFSDGIKRMRRVLFDDPTFLRSTAISRRH